MNSKYNYIKYALPELSLAGMILFIFVYLPKFLIEEYEINASLIGAALILIKAFDLILDPLFGAKIDQLKNSGFKLKTIMNLSVAPLSISFILIIALTELKLLSADLSFISATIIFFIFWTAYNLAYQSLGLSFKVNYDEKTKLFAFRDAATLIGTVIISALVILVTYLKISITQQYLLICIILATILIISNFIIKSFPENHILQKSISKSNYLEAFRNKAFNVLSINYFLTGFGSAISGSLILIYLQYVLGDSYGSKYILLFFMVSLISIPFWIQIAKNYDKKSAWIAAMLLTNISFGGVIFLQHGQLELYAILISLSALGMGGSLIMPSSMQADICLLASQEHGQPKEALYSGLWSMVKKISGAIAVGLAFPILDFAGFIANQEQTQEVKLIITLLYAAIPFVFYCLAIYIAFHYPLSRDTFKNNKELTC